MSLFLAVDLDDVVRAEVMSAVQPHREAFPTAKWLPAPKLHVTVLFLGSPGVDAVPSLKATMDSELRTHPSFTLRLEGSGRFVTARAPAVLWLGVAGERTALEALNARAVSLFGVHVPASDHARTYRPHLTLARSHVEDGLADVERACSGFLSSAFQVQHVTLYESTSNEYRALHTVALAGSGGMSDGHVHR